MEKYVCDVCGWEYDPEVGVPEAGIEPGTPWERFPMILNARYVVLTRISLVPPNKGVSKIEKTLKSVM